MSVGKHPPLDVCLPGTQRSMYYFSKLCASFSNPLFAIK